GILTSLIIFSSFGNEYKTPILSNENIYNELKVLDRKLWDEESQNLYFCKSWNSCCYLQHGTSHGTIRTDW
ncbi:MAG TPA: hypothetical protein PKM32_05895, partial [Planctomycetota bacterium]|nr:hypothetical protein [Planctomycetota bacterium]